MDNTFVLAHRLNANISLPFQVVSSANPVSFQTEKRRFKNLNRRFFLSATFANYIRFCSLSV